LFASILTSVPVFAGGGGGSGRPVTPYQDTVVTIEQILRQKDTARISMNIEIIRTGSDDRQHFSFGAFARMKKPQDSCSPAYEISGIGADGKKQSFPFECLKAITVFSMAKDTAAVRVTVFPAITPDSLLRVKPTYGNLDSIYKDSVDMKIPVADKAAKTKLYILEKKSGGEAESCLLQSLKKGDKIVFSINLHNIWWAVPSVVKDKTYPYRYQAKK
jgi:hypothetical protein